MEGNKTRSNIIETISAEVNEGDNEVAKEVLTTSTSSSNPQLEQQFSASANSGAAVTTTAYVALNSNAVHTIYVAPKVDADRYQAEIPDILPTRPSKSALDDFAVLSSKKSSSLSLDDDKREKAAIEFLQLLRNFTDPLRPASIDVSTSSGGDSIAVTTANSTATAESTGISAPSNNNVSVIRSSFWTLREVSAISLESDAAALEFLQEMNYNVDAAWFSLCIHMCRGKDWVCTHRALSFIDRLPPNMVFSECKDRVLRLNDRMHPLLGDVTERERDRDRDREGRLQSVANSLFLFSEHLDAAALPTPAVAPEPVNEIAKAGPKPDDLNVDKDGTLAVPAAGYNKPSRVANNDKLESRKKWASILSRANAMLDGLSSTSTVHTTEVSLVHSAAGPVSTARAPGKGAGTANGSKNKPSTSAAHSFKPVIEDVQALLEEAVSMNHQIVTLSNNKADEELADSLRSALGELLRAVFSAREWVAEVRDALFNYSVNGILGEEETTGARRKARRGRDYNAITTTRDEQNNGASNSSSSHSSSNGNTSSGVSAPSALATAAIGSTAITGDGSAAEAAQTTTIDAEEDECNNFAFFRKLLQKGESLFLQTKEEILLREAIQKAEAIKAQMSAIPHLCVQSESNLLQCLKKLHVLLNDWRCNENQPAAPVVENLDVSFIKLYSSIANCSDWTMSGLYSIPAPKTSVLLSLERSHLAHNALDIEQQVTKLFQSPAHETQSRKERPKLQEVDDLLHAARVNPLKIGDISYISAWYSLGEAISSRMLFFLVKSKQFRAGIRQRGQGPFVFEQVQNLLRLAQSFPIDLPGEQDLEAYLTNVENWKYQVKTLGCMDAPAKSSGADGRKRGSAKQESGPQTVPLRVVETLLLEGERLPFDLREDLDSLREKKLQAKTWLDRLKKSFVSVKVGTNRLRNHASQQGAADGDDVAVLSLQNVTHAQADRLTLAEMKNLLLEGETLYQQPTEEQQNILAENPSSCKVVARSRDLDRAQAVVENAEEWISRVKDVLTASSERDEDELLNESKEDEDDVDVETRSNRSQYRSASMLRVLMNLLDEANSMPVAMEEAQALRLHLQALQWATRLSPKLISAFQNHRHIVDSSVIRKEGDDEIEVVVDTTHAAAQTTNRIKLSELQLAAKEIAKIRSSLSDTSFGKEFAVIKALPEEEWVLQLLSASEKWVAKVKRLFANNVLKPGVTLSRLRLFYTEGISMPIDFEQYTNPMGAAIEAADSWLATHRQQLQAVGIHCSSNTTSNSAPPADSSESVATKSLDYYELTKLYNQSTLLVAEIEESKMLKQKIDDVKHVIDVVERLTNRSTPGVEFELIMFKEVEDIYRKVDAFPLDLEDEKSALISLMKAAVLWETRTRNYFLTSFMEEIKALFTSYSAIAAVNFFSVKIEPISPLVDEESLALAGANSCDLDLYTKLTFLVDSIVELKVEGQNIGVEMNATSVVCAYRDIIELMRESRNILCLHADNSKPSGEGITNTQVQYWGDVDDGDVGRMLKDIYLLLSMLGRSDVQALSGGLNGASVILKGDEIQLSEFSEEDKAVIDAILQSSTAATGDKEASVQRKRKSSEPKDLAPVRASLSSSAIEVVDNDASELQYQATVDEKTSKNDAVEAKVTRGSVGIVKRKVSDAFIDQSTPTGKSATGGKAAKSRLSLGEGSTSVTPSIGQSGAKRGKPSGGGGGARKRQKSEIGANAKAAVDTDDKVKAEYNSGDDQDANTAHAMDIEAFSAKKSAAAESAQRQLRQTLFENIEKVKNMGHHLPDSLEGLLVLWARCLEVFRYRLRHHAKEFHAVALVVLQKAQQLATGAVSIGAANLTSQVDQLLNIADRYSIQSSSRAALENLKSQVQIWSEKASSVCRAESTDCANLLNLEDLKQLLKDGERLPFTDEAAISLLGQLKQEVKSARQWIQKLSKAGIGAGVPDTSSAEGAAVATQVFDASSVAARSELVTSLLAEAQTIRVDLTQYTDQLTQMCTTYCLCRHLYHGQMIGCDTCEDWYHLHCVGISVNQAEKCDKYLCPRCLLRNSFQHSACVAAQVTHKWENMGDQHFKARQNALLKVNKKIFREESQAAKLDSYLKGLHKLISSRASEGEMSTDTLQNLAEGSGVDSIIAVDEEGAVEEDSSASKRPSLGGDASANSSAGLGSSQDLSDELVRHLPQWRSTVKELETCRSSLRRSISEREFLQKAVSLECKHAGRISQWMGRMQRVLWPSHFNDGDALAGAPIAFWAPKPDDPKETLQQLTPLTDADTLLDYLKKKDSDIQFDRLLPPGMHKYAQDARGTGSSSSEADGDGSGASDISNIEDVELVLDAFRWMSWCSVSLNLLRCPPTTVGLRRMMESAAQLRLSDDKVVKLLSSISSRASSWKSRVRKFLALPAKADFSLKLVAFRDEGFHMPISSRLMANLRSISDKIENTNLVASPVAPPAAAAAVKDESMDAGLPASGRRGKGKGFASAGFSTDLAVRVIKSVICDNSSDDDVPTAHGSSSSVGDEDTDMAANAERSPPGPGPGPTVGAGNGGMTVAGIRYSKEQLAAPPKLSWPPSLPYSLAPSLAATGLAVSSSSGHHHLQLSVVQSGAMSETSSGAMEEEAPPLAAADSEGAPPVI